MTETAQTPATRNFNGFQIPQAGTFAIDAGHSRLGFVARHLVVAKTRGQFDRFEGTLTIAEDPAASSAEVTIEAASVNTNESTRDEHLRSGDFFGTEENPNLTFRTTGLSVDGGQVKATGDLTIRGVTKPVELDVEVEGVVTDPWGNERIVVSAATEIDREDWGISWNQALETGGVMVGKKVKIEIEVEAVRQA